MTYSTNIAKNNMPAMPELYEFQMGDDFYYYTSHTEAVTFGMYTYTPAAIQRSGFTYDKDLRAILMSISVQVTDLLKKYIANTPLPNIYCTLYRAFTDDLTDYRVLYKGRIRSVQIKDMVANVSLESSSLIFRNKLPTIIHQAYCNHFVYDAGCSLSEYSFETSAVVTVSGSTLISTAFGAFANGYFTGGVAKFGSDWRLITHHTGNVLTLQIPFDASLGTGQTVKAYPGCDGAPATCRNKFNNFTNYLGFPYIPSKNPVIWGFK